MGHGIGEHRDGRAPSACLGCQRWRGVNGLSCNGRMALVLHLVRICFSGRVVRSEGRDSGEEDGEKRGRDQAAEGKAVSFACILIRPALPCDRPTAARLQKRF